ncbi:MAG: four helix bundle protein [Anaerolineae bacterium]
MSQEDYQGFETLQAWQNARELMLLVHSEIATKLPHYEKWDLLSQIRRSSKSIMANIAEGYGRYYYQENIRFCYLARGSLAETQSHLITAHDLGYISNELYQSGITIVQKTARTLNGYINWLKKSKQGGDLPEGRLREISRDYLIVGQPESGENDPDY